MRRFRIVTRHGFTFSLRAVDADVARYHAERIGFTVGSVVPA